MSKENNNNSSKLSKKQNYYKSKYAKATKYLFRDIIYTCNLLREQRNKHYILLPMCYMRRLYYNTHVVGYSTKEKYF